MSAWNVFESGRIILQSRPR